MVSLYARDGVTIWVGWCHYPDYMVSLCWWDSDTILSRLLQKIIIRNIFQKSVSLIFVIHLATIMLHSVTNNQIINL